MSWLPSFDSDEAGQAAAERAIDLPMRTIFNQTFMIDDPRVKDPPMWSRRNPAVIAELVEKPSRQWVLFHKYEGIPDDLKQNQRVNIL